jgi:hypothetical protein
VRADLAIGRVYSPTFTAVHNSASYYALKQFLHKASSKEQDWKYPAVGGVSVHSPGSILVNEMDLNIDFSSARKCLVN